MTAQKPATIWNSKSVKYISGMHTILISELHEPSIGRRNFINHNIRDGLSYRVRKG